MTGVDVEVNPLPVEAAEDGCEAAVEEKLNPLPLAEVDSDLAAEDEKLNPLPAEDEDVGLVAGVDWKLNPLPVAVAGPELVPLVDCPNEKPPEGAPNSDGLDAADAVVAAVPPKLKPVDGFVMENPNPVDEDAVG